MGLSQKAIKQFQFYFTILLMFFVSARLHAQDAEQDPVKWSAKYEKINEKEGFVVMSAQIDEHWHLFSQITKGSLPTKFKFTENPNFKLSGKVTERKPDKDYFDDIFQAREVYFEKSADFKQKIEILTDKTFTLDVKIEYQTCLDENFGGVCLNKKKKLNLEIAGTGGTSVVTPADTAPEAQDTNKNTVAEVKTPSEINESGVVPNPQIQTPKVLAALEADCGKTATVQDQSFWGIFIAGFLGGLLALLTPCVFPMIPLTVSFFTKQSKSRAKGISNAFVYALSIIVIYTLLGFLITKIAGPDALNQLSTSWFFNMLFFVVFIIFALSFFGAFEITLPSSLVNKIDSASNRGGMIGIFFMAFTLSLVSFSCTGPIIGTLLVEAAAGGNNLGPLMGMFGFSVALAFPFAFFAAFPGFLQSLPKSGGWLNSVKIVLGFLELALAMKFLSNVDLAYHWGILKREVFVAIWIAIFGLMGLYLLGKLKFSGDSDGPISIPKLVLGVLSISFTMYLLPGLWGAPLRLISGFPPPEFYKEWKTDQSDCPLGIECHHNNYEEGMKIAATARKPIMLDFTGWNCVNCRKMEENVWPEPEVFNKLNNDYVLISLYCDDREELPKNEQYVSETGDEIETVGDRWKDFQRKYFGKISQPWYVLIDHEGKLLAEPIGYTSSVTEYSQWLNEGLCRQEQRLKN